MHVLQRMAKIWGLLTIETDPMENPNLWECGVCRGPAKRLLNPIQVPVPNTKQAFQEFRENVGFVYHPGIPLQGLGNSKSQLPKCYAHEVNVLCKVLCILYDGNPFIRSLWRRTLCVLSRGDLGYGGHALVDGVSCPFYPRFILVVKPQKPRQELSKS